MLSAAWTDSGSKHNFEVDAKCENNGIVHEKKPPGREIQAISQETLQDAMFNFRERLESCIRSKGVILSSMLAYVVQSVLHKCL